MRIGQLARKYTINQDQVIQYLNKVQAELAPFHHNSKLSDDIEALVIDHFSLVPEVTEENEAEQTEEILAVPDEQHVDVSEIELEIKAEDDIQQELDPTLPPIKTLEAENKEEKPEENSIDTDTLMQLLEADDTTNNLSKITHIKAPKKELSGLKIVGKIELPESKSKQVDESEDQDKTTKPVVIKRPQRQQLSKEEKDKRRLKIIEQKERYEARQEKRRIEEENNKKKAKNRARYEEKMLKTKSAKAKQKTPKEEVKPEENDQAQVFKSISIFDKFWKLFNL